MTKIPLVVFSGGMDSTSLLYKELKTGNVDTCYIKSSQGKEKILLEMAAREKLFATLAQEELVGRVQQDFIVDLGDYREVVARNMASGHLSSTNNHVPGGTWGQAHLWLHALVWVVDPERHSSVLIGNVMGDDISCRLNHMALAWENLSSFTKIESTPLIFPLMFTTKDQLLTTLPSKLMKDLWICERPALEPKENLYHPCGACSACETAAKTVWWWEHLNKQSFKDHVLALPTPVSEITEKTL